MAHLPRRGGPRPATTPTNPHTQLDQQPPDTAQRDSLAAELFALPGVEEHASLISVPGARALWLNDARGAPADAFMIGTEFAHLHPAPDLVDEAVGAGWAEQHPVARRGLIPPNAVMLYAPRDDGEREVVASLVEAAYRYATGTG